MGKVRDLLDVKTRPAPEPRFATDWPAEPVVPAAGFVKYGVQCFCEATASAGSWGSQAHVSRRETKHLDRL